MVSTISSAPPESASRFANIAPNAIKMPTPAAVLPNPSVNDFQHVGEVSPATMPTVSPPKISARNGCSFTTVIRTTMSERPANAARMSCQPAATGSGSSGPVGENGACRGYQFFSAVVRATYVSTMKSMSSSSTSMTMPFSCCSSGSSVANCDTINEAGWRWPGRLDCRAAITSRRAAQVQEPDRRAVLPQLFAIPAFGGRAVHEAAIAAVVSQPQANGF